ncbi:MAG: phosphoribosylaminoimidazolesuccinocarboxamide synthase [Patescibacteria group bacterium]|nr:phosphoribosylaminoimidazolesuccinocarboxamide synthase [Patescibacteria group bacterium]
MISNDQITAQLPYCLTGTDFPELGEKYEGKVRDTYKKDGKITLITTDKLSAFDKHICLLPFKGQVLNGLTKFWFKKTKDIYPNYITSYPDPNIIVGDDCKPLMVEMIVRGYITGSAWRAYESGIRDFCGNKLPEGLQKDQKFNEPILTPTTKAEYGEHDESITPQEIVEKGLLTQEQWDHMAEASLKIFKLGQEITTRQGVILVDTKYEFGINPAGQIVLIDEVHTPDSSRFWDKDKKSINKEYVREWLMGKGFSGDGEVPEIPQDVKMETARRYIEAYELITGEEFKPVSGDQLSRIKLNLNLQ